MPDFTSKSILHMHICLLSSGVRDVYVSLPEEIVLVETELPSSKVQELLEGTGKLVVFRGFGGAGQTNTGR